MHSHTHRSDVDCACADDLLPYVPFTIYTATGDVVKVVNLYRSIIDTSSMNVKTTLLRTITFTIVAAL